MGRGFQRNGERGGYLPSGEGSSRLRPPADVATVEEPSVTMYREENPDASNDVTFAIVTPSYAPDFERCRLLAESILSHVSEQVHHYILVDQRDKPMFDVLAGPRIHVVNKQAVLPPWLIQLPFTNRWWLNLRGLPVRGWILQQLAKLSVNFAAAVDTYIFIDSDTFFVRDFDPKSLVRGGKVPLFRQQKEELKLDWNTRWHQLAARLLGLPIRDSYDTSYVGPTTYWKRENLTKMQRHIERVTGQNWISAVSRNLHLSEYVLYGMYAEYILGEASGQYFHPEEPCLNYWPESPTDERGLLNLKDKLEPHMCLVMINARANIPMTLIRKVFHQ
jgi:hypothetical protein